MPDLLADVAQKLRLLNGTFFSGSITGTTTDAGFFTFAHGAPFSPSKVFVQMAGAAVGPNVLLPLEYSLNATTVTISFYALLGSAAVVDISFNYRVEL